MFIAKSYSLKGKKVTVKVYSCVDKATSQQLLTTALEKSSISPVQFKAAEQRCFRMLVRLFVYTLESFHQYFLPSTQFALVLSSREDARLEADYTDEFHCLITYPLRSFFNFSKEYISTGKFRAVYQKTLAHELGHYIDLLQSSSLLSVIKRVTDKQYDVDNRHYFRFVVAELRLEGFAEFIQKRDSQYTLLSSEKIILFRQNLRKLVDSFDLDRPNLKVVYEEVFYNRDLYLMGYLMCFCIALAYHKRRGGNAIVLRNGTSVALSSINTLFKTNARIRAIPATVIAETVAAIRGTSDEEFLRLYEESCILIGLKRKYQLLWWDLYQTWNKIMHDNREKHLRGEIARAGLRPRMRSLGEQMAGLFEPKP